MRILSRKDIDAIANRVIEAYRKLPQVADKPIYKIDPELLLESLLGLHVDYRHLSLDGSILGLTSYEKVVINVFSSEDDVQSIELDGKTILVESDLTEENRNRGRCNFTLFHEGAHQILKMLFPRDYASKKSARIHYYRTDISQRGAVVDWEEWQANALASALMLPFNLIDQAMFMFGINGKIGMLNKIYSPRTYDQFSNMAEFLGSSKKALAIRMKQLDLLGEEHLDNPYEIMDVYNEGGQ